MKQRLQKILSAHGVASRRESENLIRGGRVTVNGVPADIGLSADPDEDVIRIDGAVLRNDIHKVYLMLNKPKGYVTTLKDEQGRRSVAQLVRDCPERVYPVGRLDIDSEGLLLLTNDGDFTYQLTHPSNETSKIYTVHVKGDVKTALPALSEPMIIDGYKIKPADVRLIKNTAEGGTLSITIHEGRNRQIRKMCAQTGLRVTALKRVSEGGLGLGRLKTGTWRYLSDDEVNRLKSVPEK